MMPHPEKDQPAYAAIATAHGYRTVDPLPSEQELADFYSQVYFQENASRMYPHRYDGEELAHKRLRATLVVDVALRHLVGPPAGRTLIDIGFGEGFELAAGQRAGLDVRGVDFGLDGLMRCNPELEGIAEARDPLVALREFGESGLRFDVCILKHVLEHVREPVAMMDLVFRTLNHDGVAVVTVPNDFSALQNEIFVRGATESEYWFAPPQHLQYFNSENFGGFATACGFEIVDLVGDFPIELYLLHPGSNYVTDRANGPAAHRARMRVDLFVAKQGIERYADLCRAMLAAGLSRTITAYLRPLQR
ncbi:MAG TPA: class I SAM-dependent methyltransferase [Gemmatimonadaceae bacterium]|nr:class I SAM-dependent methyltransferase [Gemmatimonadaceae bacterium]